MFHLIDVRLVAFLHQKKKKKKTVVVKEIAEQNSVRNFPKLSNREKKDVCTVSCTVSCIYRGLLTLFGFCYQK